MSTAVDHNASATRRPHAVPLQSEPKTDTLTPPLDRLASDVRYETRFSSRDLPNWQVHLLIKHGKYSGHSTPVPEDAPPSARSISTARKQARARNRLFYTIDYVPRVSHFDPDSDYHNFRGFYTLFWISLVIMVVTTVLRNIKDTGYPLRVRVWSLLTANVFELAISDLAMVVSSASVLPLHKLYRSGPSWLRWTRGGVVIQSIGEAVWLGIWIK